MVSFSINSVPSESEDVVGSSRLCSQVATARALFVDAAKICPGIGWLESLPKEEVKRFGKRPSFVKAWNERSSEFEPGSIRQISRRISRTERSARR